MSVQRRDLLRLGSLAAMGAVAGPLGGLAQAARKPSARVGVQLWSVRDDCAQDMAGTLR